MKRFVVTGAVQYYPLDTFRLRQKLKKDPKKKKRTEEQEKSHLQFYFSIYCDTIYDLFFWHCSVIEISETTLSEYFSLSTMKMVIFKSPTSINVYVSCGSLIYLSKIRPE